MLGNEVDHAQYSYSSLSRKNAIAVAWAAVVQTAAARLPQSAEETLQRIVKDALDYGVSESGLKEHSSWCASKDGSARLAALRALPSRLRHIKQWRAIDRRFDGPKHLRTRDFSDSSDYFEDDFDEDEYDDDEEDEDEEDNSWW